MSLRESQKGLMDKLAAHRPRVPPEELPLFEAGLVKIEGVATSMNEAVDELMSHVANRLTGKHFGAPMPGLNVECLHVGHPPHLCQRQRPMCAKADECWCSKEFGVSHVSNA